MSKKQLVYHGKSKDVYKINSGKYKGKYEFKFTDRGTGYLENGKVFFDPGYDNVVGDIPGKGAIACQFATYFFKLLKNKKIPSHYVDTIDKNTMIVEPAILFSLPAEDPKVKGSFPLQNLEFSWRHNAQGSFWRRYPFIKPCKNVEIVIEAWTKGKSDTLITFESLEKAGVMTKKEIKNSKKLVTDIAKAVSGAFAKKGLHLIDGKVELGRLKKHASKIVLIDEISPDVLRVCKGYVPCKNKDCKEYKNCIETFITDGERKIRAKNQLTAEQLQKVFLR